MRSQLAAAVLGAAVALAACSSEPAKKAPDAGGPECASRADCTAKGGSYAGMVCGTSGRCEACASDGQCDLRERCAPDTQRCAFRTGWGADCTLNADCAAGQLCVQGLCASAQDAVLCVDGTCLAQGQRCNRTNGVCEEDLGCLVDADCAATELCNVPTHQCVRRCTPATQATDCDASQLCLVDRCSYCATNADCPSGLTCSQDKLTCLRDGSAACLSNRDCPLGMVCNAATSFCTTPPPACSSDENCPIDQRCDIASGKCLPRDCQPDKYEPNHDPATAAPLTAGTYDNLTLCDHEQDYFSFALSRGDQLDVFVDADPLIEPYFDTRLLDSTGRIIATGALLLDRVVSSDGTYYLRLQSSDAFVDYGLRIGLSKGTPCDDDRFEPNDTTLAATPVHAAGDLDQLTICGPDVDWFAVDVPAGQGLSVELDQVPTEGALGLYVYAPDGTTLLGSSDTGQPVQTVAVAAASITTPTVLVKVSSADSRAHATYLLRIGYGP